MGGAGRSLLLLPSSSPPLCLASASLPRSSSSLACHFATSPCCQTPPRAPSPIHARLLPSLHPRPPIPRAPIWTRCNDTPPPPCPARMQWWRPSPETSSCPTGVAAPRSAATHEVCACPPTPVLPTQRCVTLSSEPQQGRTRRLNPHPPLDADIEDAYQVKPNVPPPRIAFSPPNPAQPRGPTPGRFQGGEGNIYGPKDRIFGAYKGPACPLGLWLF